MENKISNYKLCIYPTLIGILAVSAFMVVLNNCANGNQSKSASMDKVMWFDIPASDLDKSAQFYKGIFGWNILPMNPNDEDSALNFRIALTSESDEHNLEPKQLGAINGGIVTRDIGIAQPTILIQVESIEQKINKIIPAGGRIIKERTHLPLAHGYFAYVTDVDGNVIGLWEVEK